MGKRALPRLSDRYPSLLPVPAARIQSFVELRLLFIEKVNINFFVKYLNRYYTYILI
jgi:hypothetical protein